MAVDSGLPSAGPPCETRILIVEDDYIIAASLQDELESLGYDVADIADSAEDAIHKAAQLHPDLALMDIRLQGALDGIDAAKFLWRYLQVPVIYVTGHSDKGTLERAKESLPFGYLLKPIKRPELYMAITTTLDRMKKNAT